MGRTFESSEKHSWKIEKPQTSWKEWTIQEWKGYYDVLSRQLSIANWRELAVFIEASIWHPKTGDTYRLRAGKLEVLREGKSLFIYVIDKNVPEKWEAIQDNTKKGIAAIQQETKEKKSSEPIKTEKMRVTVPEEYTQSIQLLSKAFSMSKTLLVSLIERESWFRNDLVSSAQAKWIMQVRKIVFDDIWGIYQEGKLVRWRWMQTYRSYFQKIPKEVIAYCPKEEWEILKNLQSKQPFTEQEYSQAIARLWKSVANPYVNMIFWTIYLAYLQDTVEDVPKVPSIVKKLDIGEINKLRSAKWQKPLEPKALQSFAKKLEQSPMARQKFVTLASYNEGTFPKGMSHGLYYATVIMLA
jgi:hypothetical protein